MMRSIVFAVALVAFFGQNGAAEVLDQAYLDEDGDFGIGDVAAQTFTVGITGILSRVELRLGVTSNPEGNVFVYIRNAEGHSPETVTNLGAVTVPRIDLPFPIQPDEYISLDFSSQDISVNAGAVLAIIVDIGDLPGITWGLGNTLQTPDLLPIGGYPDGLALVGSNPGGFAVLPYNSPLIGLDFNFRTFVQPIPEPSALALGLWAWASVVSYRRRKALT